MRTGARRCTWERTDWSGGGRQTLHDMIGDAQFMFGSLLWLRRGSPRCRCLCHFACVCESPIARAHSRLLGVGLSSTSGAGSTLRGQSINRYIRVRLRPLAIDAAHSSWPRSLHTANRRISHISEIWGWGCRYRGRGDAPSRFAYGQSDQIRLLASSGSACESDHHEGYSSGASPRRLLF